MKPIRQSIFFSPIDRFWLGKSVFGILSAFNLIYAALAACVIAGANVANAHPWIADSPFGSLVWHGAWAVF